MADTHDCRIFACAKNWISGLNVPKRTSPESPEEIEPQNARNIRNNLELCSQSLHPILCIPCILWLKSHEIQDQKAPKIAGNLLAPKNGCLILTLGPGLHRLKKLNHGMHGVHGLIWNSASNLITPFRAFRALCG